MKYEQPRQMSQQDIELAFESGRPESIREALLSALYSEEGLWLADWCIKFSSHPDCSVRYRVAIALGNIAALECSGVDLGKCLEAYETDRR